MTPAVQEFSDFWHSYQTWVAL